ncbi:MAG: hypothetical protein KC441_05865 [Anaerolineales bacterium]|nr:hypothetical protein [Anaerolineales bacterium]
MKDIYDYGKIRALLKEHFYADELLILCFDSLVFRDIYVDLHGMNQRNMVQEILDFAKRQGYTNKLLEEIKRLRPGPYSDKEPYFTKQVKKLAKDERRRKKRLRRFLDLDADNPIVTIYLSRHKTAIDLPWIPPSFVYDTDHSTTFEALYHQQALELSEPPRKDSPHKFAVVSAVEMLEARYLKEELERSPLHDLNSDYIKEKFPDSKPITVRLDICPELKDYRKLLTAGTTIFIGGPRANFGTYLYQYGYGSKAARARLGRLDKNVVECVTQPKKKLECTDAYNLAIVQKHRIIAEDKTIFYLAGSGANGTSAAIAYFRKTWPKLVDDFSGNFTVILKVPARSEGQEDFTDYGPEIWHADNDGHNSDSETGPNTWTEISFLCD